MHKPFNSIDASHDEDLKKNDKQQGEGGCVVIKYCKPVIPWCGGEAQSKQKTKHTH